VKFATPPPPRGGDKGGTGFERELWVWCFNKILLFFSIKIVKNN
jgi:hypothetical protein